MKYRTPHRIYAFLFGYFWLPCPICGREFGGHEWRDRDGKSSTIPAPDGRSVGICPDCTRAGRGGDENIVTWMDGP